MQRRMGATGAGVLLAVLLSACSGGGDGGGEGQAKPGQPGATVPAAQPGKYDTLPEACAAVDQEALDSLLPGIQEIADEVQRERAYAGTAMPTYDTDRRVGCRWKAESVQATHHLSVDFERVVSYDAEVSDDARAESVYARKAADAGLTPAAPSGETPGGTEEPQDPAEQSEDPDGTEATGDTAGEGALASGSRDGGSQESGSRDGGSAERGSGDQRADRGGAKESAGRAVTGPSPEPGDESPSGGDGGGGGEGADDGDGGTGPGGEDGSEGADGPPSRILDDLGDSAFLDVRVSEGSSTAQGRTVTVVFRTSNVIVTIRYDDQPMGLTSAPDGKEMQDRARQLADRLADKLDG